MTGNNRMTDIQDKLVQIVKEEMHRQDVSIYRICKDTGLDNTGIGNILNKNHGASLVTLQKILDYLNINIDIRKL